MCGRKASENRASSLMLFLTGIFAGVSRLRLQAKKQDFIYINKISLFSSFPE